MMVLYRVASVWVLGLYLWWMSRIKRFFFFRQLVMAPLMWACQDSFRSKVTPSNFVVAAGGMHLPWMNSSGFGGFFRDREKVRRVDLSARNSRSHFFPHL
jgi:hypothetical protein